MIPYLTPKYLDTAFCNRHGSKKNAPGGMIKETIPNKLGLVMAMLFFVFDAKMCEFPKVVDINCIGIACTTSSPCIARWSRGR